MFCMYTFLSWSAYFVHVYMSTLHTMPMAIMVPVHSLDIRSMPLSGLSITVHMQLFVADITERNVCHKNRTLNFQD